MLFCVDLFRVAFFCVLFYCVSVFLCVCLIDCLLACLFGLFRVVSFRFVCRVMLSCFVSLLEYVLVLLCLACVGLFGLVWYCVVGCSLVCLCVCFVVCWFVLFCSA